MDELLVPEIAMDVDNPTETTETNENGASIEITDNEDVLPLSPVDNVVASSEQEDVLAVPAEEQNCEDEVVPFPNTEVDSGEQEDVPEIPSEERNGEILTDSPDLTDTIIPHDEQNGDIVDLAGDDDSDNNLTETKDDTLPVDTASPNDDPLEVDTSNPKDNTLEVDTSGPQNVLEDSVNLPLPVVEVSNDTSAVLKNCESTLAEDISPIDCIEIINDDQEAKASRKSKKQELLKAQIPNDYTPEELEVYNTMFCKGNQQIQFLRLHCTACNSHLGSAPIKQYKRFIHPLLKVLICKPCYMFYGSGEFDKDEDGSELYCRWCGQGGKVLCCAKCPYVFCQRCIKCNLGKDKLQEVLDSEDWLCFECVPSQHIKLRVIVRALYDFVQSEINLAAELNQPERLRIDSSLCCANKQPKIPKIKIKVPGAKTKAHGAKRKNSLLPDNGYINDDIHPKKKKIKLKMLSSLLSAPNGNNVTLNHGETFLNPAALVSRVWDAQDEDEVVCTPDLSLLMPMAEEDEDCVGAPPTEGLAALPPPPLAPINSFLKTKKGSHLQYMEQVQPPLNTFSSIRPPPKQLGYKLPKNAVILNASTTRPLLSKAINTVPKSHNTVPIRFPGMPPQSNINQHNRNNVPSKIVPGTKYDWFEKASQFTSRVTLNLSTRLSSLAKEQNSVSSLEGLATIHNNFQEILNNSIKSLTQIRKNLRNDFIAGLKTLKHESSETIKPTIQPTIQPTNANDDNDIIIVDAPSPIPKITAPSGPVTVGRLKLKPVASLIIDSAVITIPDDAFDEPIVINEPSVPKPLCTEKPLEQSTEIVAPSFEEGTDATLPPPADIAPLDVVEDVLNPETMALIKRALQESKFETIVIDNLKARVPDEITMELLKRMVSVRVIVENKFGPATPRIRPRRGYIPMNIRKGDEDDIENMLSSSIVLNISKRKVFNDDNVNEQSEPILNVSDEMEHLSNGIM